MSWALNLAPVPRDRGGRRNSACKAVLIGLANHANPDGTAAFPSVKTLVRYSDLSERTVRTALDRLEADGIIRPCDPAIVAAKIKRETSGPRAGIWRRTWSATTSATPGWRRWSPSFPACGRGWPRCGHLPARTRRTQMTGCNGCTPRPGRLWIT